MKSLHRQSSLKLITADDIRQNEKKVHDRKHHAKIAGGFGYSSSHVLVNNERLQLGLSVLQRNIELDQLCRDHAEYMARTQTLVHSVDSVDELKDLLHSHRVGQNVQSGSCVRAMHKEAFDGRQSAYLNMVSQNFREFGAATAKGPDGLLYMVQLFRGPTTHNSTNITVAQSLQHQQPQPQRAIIDMGPGPRHDEINYHSDNDLSESTELSN
eukprot:CAMPEP_0168741120 /NCGR_PEP_ID=MMETSP0724-20121128/12341_1 /TAXON_ID=265536 /ORGANISM="Amphiprora sp., Strain CCMP467" /LENGTH=211 /DNA_ID=CAMNT_0008788597 /DNA_START=119 /DNA_END=754 /DNA_ORIENTATION=+